MLGLRKHSCRGIRVGRNTAAHPLWPERNLIEADFAGPVPGDYEEGRAVLATGEAWELVLLAARGALSGERECVRT